MTLTRELTEPASCLRKAKADEPIFVLLGRDKAAPAAIRAWIRERKRLGLNHTGDAQTIEALQMALQMATYQKGA